MPITTQEKRLYTYKDYTSWPEGERWEIIEGRAFNMTPAPKVKHQRIIRNIVRNMDTELIYKNYECEVFFSPTDVVLDDYNIVQPDFFIVCEREKITEDNIKGPPDLIIEVTSPSTELKDRREKKELYERFGVKEYIIAFSDRDYVERYFLKDGLYTAPEIFNWDETLHLISFPDVKINLWEIFGKESPSKDLGEEIE